MPSSDMHRANWLAKATATVLPNVYTSVHLMSANYTQVETENEVH